MPAFDINTLRGVQFDFNALATRAAINPSSSTTFTVDTFYFYGDGFGAINPGTVTVLSDTYVPGETIRPNEDDPEADPDAGSYYRLPTFGSITFSNPQTSGTYWIHGFTENGIVLTRSENVTLIGGAEPLGQAYFLSNIDLYGPNSPANQVPLEGNITGEGYAPPCFAEGTLIETPAGLAAVETLAAGDLVVTAAGEHRAITWIGRMLARPAQAPNPAEFNPVRIAPHAFGPDLPRRALRLSPGHAVHVDGVLVPVGHLVNGATIVQEEVEQVRYFHVELESHDILLAEGLPCESYLDDGNRGVFGNGGRVAQLHGRLDPQSWDDACAPLVAAGPQLVELRDRLAAQALSLGWRRSEEAGLTMEADGRAVVAQALEADGYRFAVPAAGQVILRSNHGVLAHTMPGIEDRRRLGVAITGVAIDGVALDLTDPAFGAGFHAPERRGDQAWRWTDGAATLLLGGRAATVEFTVTMVAPSWQLDEAPQRLVG